MSTRRNASNIRVFGGEKSKNWYWYGYLIPDCPKTLSFGSTLTLQQGSYSDEYTVQTCPEAPGGWIFREPDGKFRKEAVNHVAGVKVNISIIVWAMIWLGGRSELVVMVRDEGSTRKGFTS